MSGINIGTRSSPLALAQARIIADEIMSSQPNIKINIIGMKTSGDKHILPFSDNSSGLKGMFTLEIEQALLEGKIDFAVHSLKDLPAEVNSVLPVIAYSHRANPFDALVGGGEVIGSSSLRRRLQLERLYPDKRILPIRGNINTRLKRLDEGEFSGLVLAASGLERLGLQGRISRVFTPDEILPAPGQGILACQGRSGEDYSYLSCVNDECSRDCALAERSFARALGAGCNVPVGAYAVIDGEMLTLRGLYVDCGKFRKGELSGRRQEAEEIGQRLAEVIMS